MNTRGKVSNRCGAGLAMGVAALLMVLSGCSADNGPPLKAASSSSSSSSSGAASSGSSSGSNTSHGGIAVDASVNLTITPAVVQVGQAATLAWSSDDVSKCWGTGSWSGYVPVDDSSDSTGKLWTPGTYSYDLSCSGTSGTASSTKVLIVGATAAPVVQLTISPTAIQLGDSALLVWSSTDATACTASDGTGSDQWNGGQPLQNPAGFNTGPVTLAGEYTYTLNCTGPGGSTTTSQILNVNAGAPPAPPALAFSVDSQIVNPGDSILLTWAATNATACTAGGGTGTDGWTGTEPLGASGLQIGPLAAGSYTYSLNCTGSGGSVSQSVSVVVGSAASLPTVSVAMTVAPTSIVAGGSANLSWTSNNASACSASGAWGGAQSLIGSSQSTGTLSAIGIYDYSLTCSGTSGAAVSTAQLQVLPPPASILSFTASTPTVTAGGSTTLSWSSGYASSCTASGGTGTDGWNGAQPTSDGGLVVGPLNTPGSYAYGLQCTGTGGGSSVVWTSITVTATPTSPAVIGFQVSPTSIQVGQSITIGWSSSNATGCTASGGTQTDGWQGSEPLSSSGLSIGPINTVGSFPYTLSCSGAGGSSVPSSATVTVTTAPPPATIGSFIVAPSSIQVGQSLGISWSSSNASGCTGSNGTGSDNWAMGQAASNSGLTIGPINAAGTYTYTLTCSGAGGPSAASSVVVTVSAAPPAATINGFGLSPNSIQVGQTTQVLWSSSNATSCTASGGVGGGSDGWGGTESISSLGLTVGPISSAGSYTYTLTCTGGGGSSTPSSVTLLVSNPPAATITSLLATPSSVQQGSTTIIAWTSSNATGCTPSNGGGTAGWSGGLAASSNGIVVGPLSSPGTYTYTLVCAGLGGASAPSSITVTSTATPPLPTVDAFTVSPTTIEVGQSATLAWSSSNSTACAGTGGSPSDGWNLSAQPTSSSGLSVGPINTAGSYTYTLVCTGAGGTSAPSSVTLGVSTPPAATVANFTITPSSITVGQSVSASWSSSNATGCTASGGATNDGWAGAQATQSTGLAVGPIGTAGTYTYSLDCTGAGGTGATSTQTVVATAPPAGAPTVALTANGAVAAQIQPGQTFTLAWSTTNTNSCSATGGTGSDGWTGSQSTLSAGSPIGPIATPGVYTYTLSCTGSGGSGSASVTLTVISSSGAECGIGEPSTLLLSPAASVSASVEGICALCGTLNVGNVVNSTPSDFATMVITAGVAAFDELQVTDGTTSYPAGRKAGFLLSNPGELLSLNVIPNITVQTLLNSTVQETGTATALLGVKALGLFADPDEGYLYLTTSKPFNAVRIQAGSLVGLLSTFHVYGACVSLQ